MYLKDPLLATLYSVCSEYRVCSTLNEKFKWDLKQRN